MILEGKSSGDSDTAGGDMSTGILPVNSTRRLGLDNCSKEDLTVVGGSSRGVGKSSQLIKKIRDYFDAFDTSS